jgi:hypothetical protein
VTAQKVANEIRALCEVEKDARTLVDALETNEFHRVAHAARNLSQALTLLEKTREGSD